MVKRKGISIYVLKLDSENISCFKSEKIAGITYLKVPKLNEKKSIDTKTNQIKIAKSIIRVILAYIPDKERSIIHMNFTFEYFIGKELALALNGLMIFTQHITLFDAIEFDKFNIEEEVYKIADAIVAVTNNGKDHLLQKSVSSEKLVTIHNGVNLDVLNNYKHENIRTKFGFKKDVNLILYSGRLDTGKGLCYLIEAFKLIIKKISNCHLVLAGDGDFKDIIELSRPISSHVSYLGFIPFSDLLALYHESTIGVIPSLKEECSYVALEMLYSGLPVVASSVGGLKEIFTHNRDALLVETTTDSGCSCNEIPKVKQMARYMESLLINEQIRIQFSRNARKKAMSEFTSDIMINKYLRLVNKPAKIL